MVKETDKEINIFPLDLSPRSYMSFDFYAPEFEKSILKSVEGLFTSGVQLVSGSTDIGTAISNAGQNIVNAGNTVINAFTSRYKSVGSVSSVGVNTRAIVANKSSYKNSIFMPLTNGITETINNQYSESSGAVASLLNQVIGPDSKANAVTTGMANFTGTRALLTNPDVVQTYKGSGLRSVVMSWTLMPKNDLEAKKILKIIRLFKRYASPELQGMKALLLAPYFCKITLTNKLLDGTLRYEEMVIESVQTDYGSSGAMEVFSDGIPKEINLSIKMNERRMKTMEDWDTTDKRLARIGDPLKPPTFGQNITVTEYNNNTEFYDG